jgi:hypothetical protein
MTAIEPKPAGGPTVIMQPQPSNAMGVAGFIFSLIGFLLCGLLCPIGALLSLIGLFKEPRGFAIAGLVIGLIGSVMLVTVGFAFFMFVLSMIGLATAFSTILSFGMQYVPLVEAQNQLAQNWQQVDTIPTEEEGNELIKGQMDVWGNQIRYEVKNKKFTLRSAGEDGQLDNSDDLTLGPFSQVKQRDAGNPDDWPEEIRDKFEVKIKKAIDEETKKIEGGKSPASNTEDAAAAGPAKNKGDPRK